MEKHNTLFELADNGSVSPALVTCSAVQSASPVNQSDCYLRNRIGELERSERTLLLQLSQLATAAHLHWPSMQHAQRLDQRLHTLRDEVRTMTQEKERGERVWRDRLQRCQNQLRAKEEEMGRQSQYFYTFKTQLQHKLNMARDRERSLQNRIHALENQLLDVTVSSATTMARATVGAVTAKSVALRVEESETPPCLREEGEGEEGGEKKKKKMKDEEQERGRKRWRSRPGRQTVFALAGGGERETDGEVEEDGDEEVGVSVNEARLQGFILSLQEDLRALLEREQKGLAERSGLSEQLQEAQDNGQLLGCQLEEAGAEVGRLQLSESALLEEVEELREENQLLRQHLREAIGTKTPSPFPTGAEPECSTPGLPGSSRHSYSPTPADASFFCLSDNPASGAISRELPSDEPTGPQNATPPLRLSRQGAAESKENHKDDCRATADPDAPRLPKPDLLNLSATLNHKPNPGLRMHRLAAAAVEVGDLNMGEWGSKGILKLEESPSEEADALMEAYQSIVMGEDPKTVRQQRDCPEAALLQAQEQSQAWEDARQADKRKGASGQQGSSREKVPTQDTPLPHDCFDHVPSSLRQDDTFPTPAADDLVQALNQENRALAERIEELLARSDLREGEHAEEVAHLRDQAARLVADGARLEREQQEQGCLITELTKKTEDDLNTIMELQQRLTDQEGRMDDSPDHRPLSRRDTCGHELQSENVGAPSVLGSGQQNNVEGFVGSLVDNLSKGGEQPETSEDMNHSTTDSGALWPQETTVGISLLAASQVDEMTKSVQKLTEEREELVGTVTFLREQHREVRVMVETQTEEKKQLTRSLWGMKEERDCMAQGLTVLKQERDQLARTVRGLRDERDQCKRSLDGMKEERGQLATSITALKDERDALMQRLSVEKGKSDQITGALQRLQNERQQLVDSVCSSESSGSLKEQERDDLERLVSSLKEDGERIKRSINDLKNEEGRVMLSIRGLKEEREALQGEDATFHSQSQTRGRCQKEPLASQSRGEVEKRAESGNQIDVYDVGFAQDGLDTNHHPSDLMREIEALGTALEMTREELGQAQSETQRLSSELCESQARLGEMERLAAEAGREKMRVTGLLEETKHEIALHKSQVRELQSALTGLVREKGEAQTLKCHLEEQLSLLQAHLQAKTVALETLNSEYTALRREQGTLEDTALVSLRTRYNDIRAKYDVLLKRKSQTDLDLAPLKAKLSCLVIKCQERNSLLVQMMRAMRRQGCVDRTLSQQAESLLSDAALQEYTTAFTCEAPVLEAYNHTSSFTGGSASTLQDYSGALTPHQCCASPAEFKLLENKTGFLSGSVLKHSEPIGENGTSENAARFCRAVPEPSHEVSNAATTELNKNATSPVPTLPVHEHAKIRDPPSPVTQNLKENASNPHVARNKSWSPTSASGARQAKTASDSPGSYHEHTKGESTSGPTCSERRRGLSRRLSSPEKIINLHQELQRTLSSMHKAPGDHREAVNRGRSPSNSASPDQATQTRNHSLASNTPTALPLPSIAGAPIQSQKPPLIKMKSAGVKTSATLSDAVFSRSANVAFSARKYTCSPSKMATNTTTKAGLSSSSILSPTEGKSNLRNSEKAKGPPNSPEIPAFASDTVLHRATPTVGCQTSPNKKAVGSSSTVTCMQPTASDDNTETGTGPGTPPTTHRANDPGRIKPGSPLIGARDAAAFLCDHLESSTMGSTKSVRGAPERSAKPVFNITAPGVNAKLARLKPEAPAEVGSIEVIRTVGQSSLLIGWERPLLDELGCSNGTFVYGYRVYVDGEFHRSVMSSACTKCILENVDPSLPVHIGVQTLGSNGLSSNRVCTMHRTSLKADHRSSGTDHGAGTQPPSPDCITSPLGLSRHKGLGSTSLQCTAISSYSPLRDSPNLHPSKELALREGDAVTLLGEPRPDGFCEAQVNDRRGLAPMVYLEEIPDLRRMDLIS